MDKIAINDKVCLKQGLTPEEVLLSLAIRSGDFNENLSNLIAREVIVARNGQYLVTQHWSDVIDEILCDSSKQQDNERLLNLAKSMMACFPKGKMPGTPYYYRCNSTEVVRKLKKFFEVYGDTYSDEQIIDATKRFVASFNGDYKYMPLIKYFISKLKPITEEDGTTHNVEFSPLADFLENEEDEDVVSCSDDWLANVRN